MMAQQCITIASSMSVCECLSAHSISETTPHRRTMAQKLKGTTHGWMLISFLFHSISLLCHYLPLQLLHSLSAYIPLPFTSCRSLSCLGQVSEGAIHCSQAIQALAQQYNDSHCYCCNETHTLKTKMTHIFKFNQYKLIKIDQLQYNALCAH